MGTRTSIRTPSPGRERTVTSPPALRARARIPIMPSGPRPPAWDEREVAGEAAAVVVNGQADLIAAGFQFDFDALGPGVARHVGQRLLRDAEQVRLGLIGKAAGATGFESRLDAGARGEALDQPAQAGLQSEIVEDGGAQKLRHLPHVADGLFHQVQAIGQARVVRLPAGVERGEVGLDRR
jgi:DNA-binding PucR family transcriptional regulator